LAWILAHHYGGAKEMKIDWFQVGRDHWEGNQDKIEQICRGVDWIKPPCTMPFMPGECISTLIAEFKIPNVSHVCYSHELAPFSLVGIRARYKNADVDFFAVDEGSHVSSLCAFVTEREEAKT